MDTTADAGVTYYYTVTAVLVTYNSGRPGGPQPETITSTQKSGFSKEVSATPALRIDCGGAADYTDSASKIWNADQDFTGGSAVSTTAAITGTADQTLYQTQRSGAQLSYAVP